MTGFVYFLRCGGFIKIGFSADPKRRLRYLQTATPFDFELLGAHPGLKWHEQQLHKVFASLRHRHEWFRADQNILEIARGGLPAMDAPSPVSNALSEFLRANNLTQAEFAEKVGATQRAVSLWLGGKRHPRPLQMRAIVRATKGAVSPNDFFTEAAE
jgi:hypothetical protein